MIDLCAGLGGASQAMTPPGWEVITVDNDPRFGCTVTTDVRTWHYTGPRPTLIWASPPCTEFARLSMPWCHQPTLPDLSIMLACKRIIDEAQPEHWILENVRGARPFFDLYLGNVTSIMGPFYLWGHWPYLGPIRNATLHAHKERLGSSQAAERAKVPYIISYRVREAIERQMQLWPTP